MPNYSETLMEHFNYPRNTGIMESPDAVGFCGTPDSSPFMVLHLRIEADRISEARYKTHGCGPLIASGSALTSWLIGKSLDECRGFDEAALVLLLDGIPDEKRWCPVLAVRVLQGALDHYSGRTAALLTP